MKTPKIRLIIGFLLINSLISAQSLSLRNTNFNIRFDVSGVIMKFEYNGKEIEFRKDSIFKGPSIYFLNKRIILRNTAGNSDEVVFQGETPQIKILLSYFLKNEAFAMHVTVENKFNTPLLIDTLMLRLGLNTEMDAYPHWNKVYFPSLLRCEKDFFWGYFMNPEGSILTITSSDPIASWNNCYNKADNDNSDITDGGHRIYTSNLDLMHTLPLPERHPQNLNVLKSKEIKSWTVYLQPANDLKKVEPIASSLSKAVMLCAPLYTLPEHETFHINVIGKIKAMKIITPDKKIIELIPSSLVDFTPANGLGKYILIAISPENKTTEATFSVRRPWTWYLKQARLNAIEKEQKGGSHTDGWYGLFSMFLAQKYFPDPVLQGKCIDKFNELFPLMYDKNCIPVKFEDRLQNTACMASLLAIMYSTLMDTSYLTKASQMCDLLISKQDSNGVYRNNGIHYTSVVYVAKSILEVCRQESILSKENNI